MGNGDVAMQGNRVVPADPSVETAFSGQRFVMSKPGRSMARWKSTAVWRTSIYVVNAKAVVDEARNGDVDVV